MDYVTHFVWNIYISTSTYVCIYVGGGLILWGMQLKIEGTSIVDNKLDITSDPIQTRGGGIYAGDGNSIIVVF